MKIKDVRLSILRTELDATVIPTQGAVDKLPQLVLVSVSTHEGIDGHYVSYLIPAKAVEHEGIAEAGEGQDLKKSAGDVKTVVAQLQRPAHQGEGVD